MLAAATGLLLIIFNGGCAASWETFTIFALMFTGTLLYRAEAGQFPWRRALYVTILVSYSVYLLHPVLIEVYHSLPCTRHVTYVPKELMLAAVFVTVLLVCCGLTHWCIEAPMQRLGRRVASWLDARFGPDTRPPAWHANRARSIRPSNRTRSARSM